jgi:hypothetical protein
MLAPLLALALAATSRIAVLPVPVGEGVPAGTAAAVAEAVAGEVRRNAGFEVITQREISAILTLERQQQMLGCQTNSCMAELGGALGCDRLVVGDLARLGESWLFSLKLVEVGKARVSSRADRRLRGGTIDDVLDQLPNMVSELLARATKSAPASRSARPAVAPAPGPGPGLATTAAPVPWAEEPVEVDAEVRERLVGYADPAGHLIVTVPFTGMEAPFFWGDTSRLFLLRLQGGGQDRKVGFDRSFWDPRARVPAEASFEVRDGRARLTCGDRSIALRVVPPGELAGLTRASRFLAPRWRRIPLVLARDDGGTYYYVDGAGGADGLAVRGKPGHQLYVGRKGKLARLELTETVTDVGGQLFISPAGRLELKRRGTGPVQAAWLVGKARTPLTWLDPADHGPFIHSELGVYGGDPLGTPCDGRL